MTTTRTPPPHVLSGSFRLNRPSPQADRLDLWLPLGLDTIRDFSGGDRTGVMNGSASRNVDNHGWHLACDGTDGSGDYLSVANHPRVDPAAEDFTVAFWVKASGYVNQGSSINCFASKGGMASNPAWGIGLRGDDSLSFWINAFETNPAYTATGTTWKHIVATRVVASGAIVLYGNGVSIATNTGDTNSVGNTDVLGIGGDSTHGQRYTAARFRDFRFYRRALTAPQVWDIYAHPYDLFARPVEQDYWQAQAGAAVAANPQLLLLGVG